VLVSASEVVSMWPVIGVAAGSLAGLIANFILSRRFVFDGR
jgi:putative flippase GtrA